jgi:site-specific DNA recombinase
MAAASGLSVSSAQRIWRAHGLRPHQVRSFKLSTDPILLSFAQFEREVIGERIRDKFAASRANGMWMGGCPPLGYDVRDHKLVVNSAEAELVRLIFRRFLDLGSALLLIRELNAQGHSTKSWTTQGGHIPRGTPRS